MVAKAQESAEKTATTVVDQAKELFQKASDAVESAADTQPVSVRSGCDGRSNVGNQAAESARQARDLPERFERIGERAHSAGGNRGTAANEL